MHSIQNPMSIASNILHKGAMRHHIYYIRELYEAPYVLHKGAMRYHIYYIMEL